MITKEFVIAGAAVHHTQPSFESQSYLIRMVHNVGALANGAAA